MYEESLLKQKDFVEAVVDTQLLINVFSDVTGAMQSELTEFAHKSGKIYGLTQAIFKENKLSDDDENYATMAEIYRTLSQPNVFLTILETLNEDNVFDAQLFENTNYVLFNDREVAEFFAAMSTLLKLYKIYRFNTLEKSLATSVSEALQIFVKLPCALRKICDNFPEEYARSHQALIVKMEALMDLSTKMEMDNSAHILNAYVNRKDIKNKASYTYANNSIMWRQFMGYAESPPIDEHITLSSGNVMTESSTGLLNNIADYLNLMINYYHKIERSINLMITKTENKTDEIELQDFDKIKKNSISFTAEMPRKLYFSLPNSSCMYSKKSNHERAIMVPQNGNINNDKIYSISKLR